MCYSLYLATPLTLSEVRSMLPEGMSADPLPTAEQRALFALHPAARTGVRLLLGPCACDFLIARDSGSREDERHLRARLSRAGLSRAHVIATLEAHRRSARRVTAPPAEWQAALARFVVEHARNAGPTLYLLCFGPGTLDARATPGAVTLPVTRVEPKLASWLPEDQPTIVLR